MQENLFSSTKSQHQRAFTVSQYAEYVNGLVAYEPVLVEGEVSNYRDIPGRNFCYFDIKDDKAVAKCFQGFWQSAKIELSNGAMVKVFGYPGMQKNGTFVIDVRQIMLSGEGVLMQAYLKLKEKLEREGLFEDDAKKPLPVFPQKVGLIAGKNSSAYHDVVAELAERWGGSDVYFFPSKVQGLYAKQEIVSAIRHFNQKVPVDVLIIARGGGSMEDLQAFDSEEVVREIFGSKIPVISAIGHEDHWTLSDFVADQRAKTPTKAAQIAVPDKKEISERLDYFSTRSRSLISNLFAQSKERLDGYQSNLNVIIFSIIVKYDGKLDEMKICLGRIIADLFSHLEEKLLQQKKELALLDPQRVLRRGYGIVEKNGSRISSVKQIKLGDELVTRLHDGKFVGKILKIADQG